MLAADVLDKNELPNFDDKTGLLLSEYSDEEDIELEIVEEEPPFLHSHRSNLRELSPVRRLCACNLLHFREISFQ